LQVAGLLRAFDRSDIPAGGLVTASAKVAGTLSQPIASVHVKASELVAYNERWGTLVADARVAGRRVDVDSVVVDKPQESGNGRITATGSYQLNDRRYAVDLQSENVRLVSLLLPGDRAVTGAIEITARGAGTVDQPGGQINLRAGDLIVDEYAIGNVVADTTLANRIASTFARAE
jgi:autotransporter translocation and assembly factor TamB